MSNAIVADRQQARKTEPEVTPDPEPINDWLVSALFDGTPLTIHPSATLWHLVDPVDVDPLNAIWYWGWDANDPEFVQKFFTYGDVNPADLPNFLAYDPRPIISEFAPDRLSDDPADTYQRVPTCGPCPF